MLLRMSWLLVVIALAVAGCSSKPVAPVTGRFEVVAMFPHDPEAYTQGLQFERGRLWESTGLYGHSTVREVDPTTGAVLRRHPLPDSVFGEGLTRHDDDLWVLTWREQSAFVIDPDTFAVIATNRYDGEGWGLTSDGTHLIKSDGTSRLTWIDPITFATVRTLPVTEQGQPVMNLNELEWVENHLFANVYMQDRIVRINPRTGNVDMTIDLSGLRALLPLPHRAEVLNGIAWNAEKNTLLVTGKYWPLLFELRLME